MMNMEMMKLKNKTERQVDPLKPLIIGLLIAIGICGVLLFITYS